MNMKKKFVSLLAAGMLAVQAMALPLAANAEITALPYIDPTDFTDVAAAPGLPLREDGNPWLFKGSAAVHTETLEEEDGKKFAHCVSDSVKEGKEGEGSWYFYYRNQKSPITEEGWAKFDIRMNQGVIQFQTGTYTDPTKGGDVTSSISIDALSKKITATGANGKIEEIVPKLAVGEWYTVLEKINSTEGTYSVLVTDKDGNEYSADDIAFVSKDAQEPLIFVFAYLRKSGAHDFDLTNLSIGKGAYDPSVGTVTAAPEPTAAPTAEPTTAPEPTAAPTEAPTAAPASAPVILQLNNNKAIKDGASVALDVAPVLSGDRTMVPLRFLSETFGAKVDWDDATKTVTMVKDTDTIVMGIDKSSYTVNGEEKTLDVPAQIMSDRTMVPIRAVLESFGKQLYWNADNSLIVIDDTLLSPDSATITDWVNKLK